jgi:hypothetical protein
MENPLPHMNRTQGKVGFLQVYINFRRKYMELPPLDAPASPAAPWESRAHLCDDGRVPRGGVAPSEVVVVREIVAAAETSRRYGSAEGVVDGLGTSLRPSLAFIENFTLPQRSGQEVAGRVFPGGGFLLAIDQDVLGHWEMGEGTQRRLYRVEPPPGAEDPGYRR